MRATTWASLRASVNYAETNKDDNAKQKCCLTKKSILHNKLRWIISRATLSTRFSYWHFYYPLEKQEQYTSLHDDGGNLLFLDGHSEYRKGRTLRSGDFGLSPSSDDRSAPADKLYDAGF